MSRRCEVCGKKARSGFNVSHSHVKTKRKWLPNLQTMRVSINGTPKSMLVCAKCIKAGKVTRQPAKQQKQLAT